MQFGAVFPNEIANDTTSVRDFVQAVEDFGYAYILVYEQTVEPVLKNHR